MAHLSAASLLLVVVRVRRLCAEDLRDRRAHRGVGRDGRDRHRDWHVGLARKGSEEGRNLWFGALGERTRSEAGQDARRRWRRSWPLRAALSAPRWSRTRSEEHTSELQSLLRISYAVFCLKKKTTINTYARRKKR